MYRARLRVRPASALLLLGALAAAALGFMLYIGMFWGNIRTVTPARAYRSGQLPPERLRALIRERGIRTVIAVNGGHPGNEWYRRQGRVCREDGVALHSIFFRAGELPPPAEVRKLVRLLDEAERPLLLHCRAGSDRTGLASTLYLHLEEAVPLDDAQARCLSWHTGHFPFFAGAMDRFLDLYRESGSGKSLRDWIMEDYSRPEPRMKSP